MTKMKCLAAPALAAISSGAMMAGAMGFGGTVTAGFSFWWVIALLAPVPALWFSFRSEKILYAAEVALIAGVIGNVGFAVVYASVLPLPVLAMAIAAPSLGFAAAVVLARFVASRVTPISGVLAYAFAATGIEYLISLGDNGAVFSAAYAQVEMPAMIQLASVLGLWGISFVVALFAAALAMFVARRQPLFLIIAASVLVLNLGFGYGRMLTAPQTASIRVGLAADDRLVDLRFKNDLASAAKVVTAYTAASEKLAGEGATLIVLPERLAVMKPEWRSALEQPLQRLAQRHRAVVVSGFDLRESPRRNAALVFAANGAELKPYYKRHLVPGLEAAFSAGTDSFMLADGSGVAICKDLDFPASIRAETVFGPSLYAIPAWDFGDDGVWHARLAIMRGVENGFAVARSANNGLLTLSDAYGRVTAVKTSGAMATLVGDVARGPGKTLYQRIGDIFGELAILMSLVLLAVGVATRKRTV